MPRSSVVLSQEPVDWSVVARAAAEVRRRSADAAGAEVEVRPLDDGGAALQVMVDGVVVLTVLRPRPAPAAAERGRVLPGVTCADEASWWTEAYTPWTPEGQVGSDILQVMADALAGWIVGQADISATTSTA